MKMRKFQKKQTQFVRPIAVLYYDSMRVTLHSAAGYASTIDNAKRNAVGRIILEQWARARIIDRETEQCLMTLTRTQAGITIRRKGE